MTELALLEEKFQDHIFIKKMALIYTKHFRDTTIFVTLFANTKTPC